MNATVREWIDKAGGDYATAGREPQATSKPDLDAVCYHAQQCIEKLMKGLLIHLGVVPPRTHDPVYLDQLLVPVCPAWSAPVEDLRFLTHASAAYRYPGESADRPEANQAFAIANRLRSVLLSLFLPE
jgi:HEPN domain-containing protein